jgi:hypothetical protein
MVVRGCTGERALGRRAVVWETRARESVDEGRSAMAERSRAEAS